MRVAGAAALALVAVAARSVVADDAPTEDTLVQITAVRGKLAELGVVRFDLTLEIVVPAFSTGATSISLPTSSAVTSATLEVDGTRRSMALELATTVRDRFDALYATAGAGTSRTWAARLDAASDGVLLEVLAPVAARGTVSLSLDAPTCWDADARVVAVPTAWVRLLPGVNAVTDARDAAALDEVCDASRSTDQTWVRYPSRELAKRGVGEPRIGMTAARLASSPQPIARAEITLASEVTSIPRDLYTVLVVDESRSLDEDERALQREVVTAYLRAAPRGRVQVVAYARDAQRVLPGWMVADRAALRIDRELRQRPLRNGSSIVRAIAAAGDELAHVDGTRRVIVLTDERLTDETTVSLHELADALPARTIAHVVSLHGFGGGLARDDDGVLAPLATATLGASMMASVDEQGPLDALALVRPISFDKIHVRGAHWTTLGFPHDCEEGRSLAEGRSCVWTALGEAGAGPIEITGWLWGRRVTRTLATDESHPRTLARILQSNSGLPSELLADIERIARAVNGTWSLAATWGGGGGYLDEAEGGYGTLGMSGFGTSGHDFIDGIGTARIGRLLGPELIAQLRPAVQACHPKEMVGLAIELTRDEIANVTLTLTGADRALETCIADGVWATPVSFALKPEHETVKIAI